MSHGNNRILKKSTSPTKKGRSAVQNIAIIPFPTMGYPLANVPFSSNYIYMLGIAFCRTMGLEKDRPNPKPIGTNTLNSFLYNKS